MPLLLLDNSAFTVWFFILKISGMDSCFSLAKHILFLSDRRGDAGGRSDSTAAAEEAAA